MTSPPILTPNCPGCGAPPAALFDDGRQAFCSNDTDCRVVLWDATADPTDLGARLKRGEVDHLPPTLEKLTPKSQIRPKGTPREQ